MATSTELLTGAPVAAPSRNVTANLRRGWRRALVPSFSDCLFLALLAWLFVCGSSGWKALLGDGDTGWHIRTGQYILAHHAVPTVDLFSFSRLGAPWFAWEWLSDTLFATLFGIAGLKAVVLFSGVLIVLQATVIVRYAVWRGSNGLVATFTTLLAVGASSMHFLARPHLFTLLFVPACIWMLEVDRRKNTPLIWLLVPLTVLWTNLHGGFVIFLALLGVLIAGSAVEACLGMDRWPAVHRYTALLAGCSLASLVNPYGVALHEHILQYLRADWIKDLVVEFQAPTFRTEGQLQFEALLLAGLVVAGLLIRKRLVTEALWLVFLAHSSLISVRHAPIFAAIAAPLVAVEVSAAWGAWSGRLGKSSAVRILHQMAQDVTPAFRHTSLWPAAAVLGLALMGAPVKWPADFPSEMFPTGMVQNNAGLIASGRLLTTDQWGDYIIFHFYPRQKVYVDGRSDFYGETLGREYLHLLQGAYDWREILVRRGFDVALLPVNWPLAALLKQDRSWQVVQDDGGAILFRRLGLQTHLN
ncbi:MAG TPA: hypothetical protein VMH80_01245 [Bryobacteraceae bacterium]|nr:hypothetical protein [Bryobacteraceae bacterium]